VAAGALPSQRHRYVRDSDRQGARSARHRDRRQEGKLAFCRAQGAEQRIRIRTPGYLTATHDDLMRMHSERLIRLVIARRFRLEETPAAIRALADRRVMGKAVVEP